jgi:hypothetical protein
VSMGSSKGERCGSVLGYSRVCLTWEIGGSRLVLLEIIES